MYKILIDGAKRLADGAYIPADPHNQDWQEFLAWKAVGNVPEAEFSDAELLVQAKVTKQLGVLSGFDRDSRGPIAAAGTLFPGGEEAMMELDRDIRFARLLGLEECEVADVDGIDRALSLADAEELLKTMVAGWQAMVKEKRARLFDLKRAATVEEVEEIPARGFKDIISGRTEEGQK